MRSYSSVVPAFWTGATGKAITAAGKDARIAATYVVTCEHSNMLGIYRLPLLYAAEETGLKRREVVIALRQLSSIGFADYDEATEFIWVIEMARYQLNLLPGEPIKDTDHRKAGVERIYRQLPSNPFLGPFYDRYAQILSLPRRRDFSITTKPLGIPLEGASEPLGRDYGHGHDPGQDWKGDAGETRNASPVPSALTPEHIQERWNTIPGVKPCKILGKSIRDRIRSRLTEHRELDWWDHLLQRVQASDFLCGRTNGTQGPFHVSLDWALEPKNLDKILAGNFDLMPSNDHASKIHRSVAEML